MTDHNSTMISAEFEEQILLHRSHRWPVGVCDDANFLLIGHTNSRFDHHLFIFGDDRITGSYFKETGLHTWLMNTISLLFGEQFVEIFLQIAAPCGGLPSEAGGGSAGILSV